MKKIIGVLLVVLATTKTESNFTSVKDTFLLGVITESIPPVTWIPGLMCISDRTRSTSAMVGFVSGIATMATIQAALAYLFYKGAQSILAQKRRATTKNYNPKINFLEPNGWINLTKITPVTTATKREKLK